MSTRPRKSLAIVAAALTFAVTGCTATSVAGTGTGVVQTTTSSEPTTGAPTTTAHPYLTTTPTLELSDQTTKPGAKLKFGDQAVVPYNSEYAKGLLGITVTIDTAKASDADIDNLPLKDADKAHLRGKVFFFIRQSLVDIDGANFAGIWAPTLWATTRSGGFPGTLFGMGDIGVTGCENPSFAPSDFSVKGARFDQCQLYFGVASDPVTSLAFTRQPYESAATRAVTWRNK